MSASTEHPRTVPRSERRIIERPRLIKLLDESEARVILLLAPAGYGKTTLARQWFKTLNGAIWISLTPAHRDVATFTREIARGIGSEKFFSDYLGAMRNPQRAAREIGREVGSRLDAARVSWLVLDDWHEVDEATELVALLEEFQANAPARILVASRARPTWATSRQIVYGEVEVVGREALAMTDGEAERVLGTRDDAGTILRQAAGWPAVLGLASATMSTPVAGIEGPSGLHAYFAEELFASASDALQDDLLELALRGTSNAEGVPDQSASTALLEQARDLGSLKRLQIDSIH